MGYKEIDNMILFNFGYLSQWYPSRFVINGIIYNCAEQYMMAQKSIFFNDKITLKKIMKSNSPKVQKELGREVKNFNKIKWESVCRNIVYSGNFAKFKQNKDLKEKLLSTGNKLIVEASPNDTVWGIGRASDDPLALNRNTWKGTNWLGEVLMKVRKNI